MFNAVSIRESFLHISFSLGPCLCSSAVCCSVSVTLIAVAPSSPSFSVCPFGMLVSCAGQIMLKR